MHGWAVGLLMVRDGITVSDMISYVNAYLFGTGEMMKRSGLFLGGIFFTAWDIIFHHSEFLDGISNVLGQLDEDSFLVLLPDLRLAFSTFSPSSINRIAETVAQSLGHGDDMLTEQAVPEKTLSTGIKLDEYAAEILRQRGIA